MKVKSSWYMQENYKGGGEGGWLKIMFTNFAKEGRKGEWSVNNNWKAIVISIVIT